MRLTFFQIRQNILILLNQCKRILRSIHQLHQPPSLFLRGLSNSMSSIYSLHTPIFRKLLWVLSARTTIFLSADFLSTGSCGGVLCIIFTKFKLRIFWFLNSLCFLFPFSGIIKWNCCILFQIFFCCWWFITVEILFFNFFPLFEKLFVFTFRRRFFRLFAILWIWAVNLYLYDQIHIIIEIYKIIYTYIW